MGGITRFDFSDGTSGTSSTMGGITRYDLNNGITGTSSTLGGITRFEFSDGTSGTSSTMGGITRYDINTPTPTIDLNIYKQTTPQAFQPTTPKLNINTDYIPAYTVVSDLEPYCTGTAFDWNAFYYSRIDYYDSTRTQRWEDCQNDPKMQELYGGGTNTLFACVERNTEAGDSVLAFNETKAKCDEYKRAGKTCPKNSYFYNAYNKCTCGIAMVMNAAGTECVLYSTTKDYKQSRCPSNSTFDESTETCFCNKGYALYKPKQTCVAVPDNAYTVETATDAWLCYTGYEEIDGKCIKPEDTAKQQAIMAIISEIETASLAQPAQKVEEDEIDTVEPEPIEQLIEIDEDFDLNLDVNDDTKDNSNYSNVYYRSFGILAFILIATIVFLYYKKRK
jgi:hypothetical protein